MKPNLIVVQPPHIAENILVERFCETFSETHYVYLIRSIPSFREDSPSGVRFLNFSPDRLPGFGEVERVIAIGDPEIADRLRQAYPDARHTLWEPDEDGFLAETIVRGEFGRNTEPPLARAM